jgi:hypothetical protein
MGEDKYNIVAKYGYEGYPKPEWFWFQHRHVMWHTGRHLVMMPHIERSTSNGTGRIIQRIETMKFHLGMKPCECQKMDR